MSDTIYKIFPKDYLFLPDDDLIKDSVSLLKPFINEAPILWEKYEHPTFIDCGDGLTTVSCPYCKKLMPMELWANWLDISYKESKFYKLSISVPCCEKQSNLNDLIYNKDCGFAMFSISIYNLEDYYPHAHEMYEAGKVFGKDGSEYKMIVAHY